MGERACYTNFNLVQIMSAEYKGFGNQREETILYQRTKARGFKSLSQTQII